MSTEFMRHEMFLRSETDYRTNGIKDGLRRSRNASRVRRARKPAERID